jgi:hypothetical protein
VAQSGATRRHHGREQKLGPLDFAGARRRATQLGAHAGGDAGLQRLAIVERSQHPAAARTLEAHVHDSEPVLGADGLQRIRRRRTDAPLGVLWPRGRRDGRAVQVQLLLRGHGRYLSNRSGERNERARKVIDRQIAEL